MKKEILRTFLYNDGLKFNEIEKLTKLRSNKLAYYLKGFMDAGVLFKNREGYFLSEESESSIPYMSDKKAILPVVLIAIGKKGHFFLSARTKKPYRGLLGLPGGRILVGETIGKAVKRIMKNKYGVDAVLSGVNSVSLEHLKKKGEIIHGFLLILVTASARDKIPLTNISSNKNKMIRSDYWLLKNHFNLKSTIKVINSKI